MTFIERVQKLNLPLGEVVVIGSGLLDVLGLRRSSDVDLVVSQSLFDSLRQTNGFKLNFKAEQPYLTYQDYEIWTDWGPEHGFEVLKASAVSIDGVNFVSPEILIEKKRQRGLERDLKDIQLLSSHQITSIDKSRWQNSRRA